MLKALPGIVVVLAALSVPMAQEKEYEPACKGCQAAFVFKSEVDTYLKRALANNLIDQQMRAVDVGRSNLGVGIVYRGKTAKPEAIAEHDLVSELYHIIDGSATLVLGADLEGKVRRPASLKTVRMQNGPGNGAQAMRDGIPYELGKGDLVFIPAGTGHQFTRVDPNITYLMVRIDPDKIVPTKNEAESKADLLTTGVETPEEAKAAGEKNKHLEKEWEPTCKMRPGTYVPNSEVQAYIKRAISNQLLDQQIRAVDFGKTHLAAGIVHRTRLDKPEANVAEHDLVSELYHVISGSGTLKVGPDLVGKVRRPSTSTSVRLLNGPGNDAKDIRNAVSHEITAGDIVIIPAGTGHHFTRIDDHITYLIVRLDPQKVTPLKSEADSKKDLETDGRATSVPATPAAKSRP